MQRASGVFCVSVTCTVLRHVRSRALDCADPRGQPRESSLSSIQAWCKFCILCHLLGLLGVSSPLLVCVLFANYFFHIFTFG